MKNIRLASNLLLIQILLGPTLLCSQVEMGNGFVGNVLRGNMGSSVSMPDANTVLAGAPMFSDPSDHWGYAAVYTWNGLNWEQKGSNLPRSTYDYYMGYRVSMPDANTVAVTGAGGGVKVLDWNGTDWVYRGYGIVNGNTGINDIDMPDKNYIAIKSGNENQLRAYRYKNGIWQQMGSIFENELNKQVKLVQMPDTNTVFYTYYSYMDGYCSRVIDWNGSSWEQRGALFNYTGATGSYRDISMPTPTTLAMLGLEENAQNNLKALVRVYTWSGLSWVAKGAPIKSELDTLEAYSLTMPDANTIALMSRASATGGSGMCYVELYKWNGTEWQMQGNRIPGLENNIGEIAMSDPDHLAFSSVHFDNAKGKVRVFDYSQVSGLEEENSLSSLRLYPNPTKGKIYINFSETIPYAQVIVRDLLGKEVKRYEVKNENQISLFLEGENQLYLIEVIGKNAKSIHRIVKNN